MRAAILIATLFAAGTAQAKVPLSDVKPINDGLTAVAIADHIRVNCDNISARLVVAWRYIGQLEDQAKGEEEPNGKREVWSLKNFHKTLIRRRPRHRCLIPISQAEFSIARF